MKVCFKCKSIKEPKDFYRKSEAKDKLSPWCIVCHKLKAKQYRVTSKEIDKQKIKFKRKTNPRMFRKHELKKNFGLDISDYDKLLVSQKGLCKICSKVLIKPCVDHDHKTGKIRGLLCNSCNLGLGCFKDSINFIESAILYLEKHNGFN